MTDGIFWMPPILFQEEHQTLLFQIVEMVFLVTDYGDTHDTRDVQIISLSKAGKEIRAQFADLREVPMFQGILDKREFIIGQDFDIDNLSISKSYEHGNNHNISLHQFIDNKSTSLFEIPRPNIARLHVLTAQWMVELEVLGEGNSYVDNGYVLPANRLFGNHLLSDIRHVKNDPVIRVDIDYFVLKCPQNGVVRGGTSINDYLISPRLSLLSNFEIFEQLFDNIGCEIKISDKGNFMRASIELFDSVQQLAEELANPAIVKMFNVVMDESKPSDRDKKGIPGVLVSGRVYVSFEDVSKAFDKEEEAFAKIDEYVRKKIFTKGYILQCERCRAAEWYRLEQVGQSFLCRRCNRDQIFSKHRWREGHQPNIFYKLDEMLYHGYKNNMRVPVLTLAKIRAQTKKSFMYIPEVVVINQRNKNQQLELDIVCIQDGKLIIGECKKGKNIDNDQLNRYNHIVNALNAHFIFASLSNEVDNVKERIALKSWINDPIIMSLNQL